MVFCVPCESDCESEAGHGFAVPDFAEIVVIRHGETAWNAEGRIQVPNSLSFSTDRYFEPHASSSRVFLFGYLRIMGDKFGYGLD